MAFCDVVQMGLLLTTSKVIVDEVVSKYPISEDHTRA